MTENEFLIELKKIDINITEEQKKQLNRYYELLIEWNEKINLTAITDKKQVYLKHFYDCLTISKVYDFSKKIKICDVGSGAGFPGIVLKIVFPNLEIELVDSLMKRIKFLNLVIEELNLKNINTTHARIEEFTLMHKEEFDIVTARAVTNLRTLVEITSPTLKILGKMIFLKGDIEQEVKESTNAIEKLNLSIENIQKFNLPVEESKRSIIVIRKERATPKKYPRKFAEIKNKPL